MSTLIWVGMSPSPTAAAQAGPFAGFFPACRRTESSLPVRINDEIIARYHSNVAGGHHVVGLDSCRHITFFGGDADYCAGVLHGRLADRWRSGEEALLRTRSVRRAPQQVSDAASKLAGCQADTLSPNGAHVENVVGLVVTPQDERDTSLEV